MPRRPGRTWARSANWPGVGSVCRQQRTGQIAATARLLGELGVDLHHFGVKLTGLTGPELQRDLRRPLSGGVASLDSESWSLEARYGTRRPDCTHLGRDGQPNKCNNCPASARLRRSRPPCSPSTTCSPTRPEPPPPKLAAPRAAGPKAASGPALTAPGKIPRPDDARGFSLVTQQIPHAAAAS